MTNQTPALIQKDITDQVSGKLGELQAEGLVLPPNYNPSNALKSAFFKLQEVKDKNKQPALSVCTKESIANTLLDMVTQGLSSAKTQCYFVVYGNKLQLNRSYFGTQAVLKRLSNVNDVKAYVVRKGEDISLSQNENGDLVVKHQPNVEHWDNDIIGAYCRIYRNDGTIYTEYMSRKQIDKSWSKAKTNGVQQDFSDQMAMRTVINRAGKWFINTSDDSDLLVQAINNSTENEYENERVDITPQEEIEQNANQEILDVGPEPDPVQEQKNEEPDIEAEYREVIQPEEEGSAPQKSGAPF